MLRPLLLLVGIAVLQDPSSFRRELLIVSGEPLSTELVERLSRRRTPVVRLASDVTARELARGHVAIVGTPRDNRLVRELDGKLGLAFHDNDAEWQGHRYDLADHALQLRTTSPWRPEASLELWLGAVESNFCRRRADVHIRRNGKTILLGFERDDGGFDVRRFATSTVPVLEAAKLQVFAHGTSLTPEHEAVLTQHATKLEQKVTLHVYPDLETKGLVTEDTTSAHAEGLDVHAVLGLDLEPLCLLYEISNRDPSAPRLLERGRAMLASASKPELDRLDRVASRLLRTSEPPSIARLLDDEIFESVSPFVSNAVAASFARFVGTDVEGDALDGQASRWARALSASTPMAVSPVRPLPAFHKGMTFAHQGYRIHDGYLSHKARESLSRLHGIGVDSVAIVPYAFMPTPTEVVPLSVPTRAGSETDEDVAEVIRSVKAQGMAVMLKPQIWIRRSWPGDIAPSGEEGIERFFTEYRRWIRHYAMLAEAHDVPLFAIGTELSKLTGGHRAQWERVIEDVRCLYTGRIVYAANWGKEVESVVFWDLVDFIGVDFYYPLSFDVAPSDDALREGFENALVPLSKLHARYRKPILFTEVGYASTNAPWRKPHASDKEPEFSNEDQARAYEIALAAVAERADWIHGMYWWKWPTNIERGGAGHRGFTPNGKRAEDVLRRWYRSRIE